VQSSLWSSHSAKETLGKARQGSGGIKKYKFEVLKEDIDISQLSRYSRGESWAQNISSTKMTMKTGWKSSARCFISCIEVEDKSSQDYQRLSLSPAPERTADHPNCYVTVQWPLSHYSIFHRSSYAAPLIINSIFSTPSTMSFPFLNLPAALRNKIYAHIVSASSTTITSRAPTAHDLTPFRRLGPDLQHLPTHSPPN
jgi:hypothetical protein